MKSLVHLSACRYGLSGSSPGPEGCCHGHHQDFLFLSSRAPCQHYCPNRGLNQLKTTQLVSFELIDSFDLTLRNPAIIRNLQTDSIGCFLCVAKVIKLINQITRCNHAHNSLPVFQMISHGQHIVLCRHKKRQSSLSADNKQ